MNNVNKAALAGLQLAAVVGSLTPSTGPAKEINTDTNSQYAINQVSLKSIEQSWLMVPRMCKAAGFNAQPVSLPSETRNKTVKSIYSAFAV